MARPRATDHGVKRRAILKRSAERFAEQGYTRTSMAEIAEACGSSKALLYHYYTSKEQILYDVLHGHFARLEEAVAIADRPGLPAQERLLALVTVLLETYEGADATHKVQLNDLAALPPDRQGELKDAERRLVNRFARVLSEINPRLARGGSLLKPVTMSLFGMINWHYLWFRPGGAMSRRQYAALVTQMMVDGIANLGESRPVRRKPAMRAAAASSRLRT
ncbi:MAG: TetR/AcrR family transcriptional regulator [Hyphomicrobiaceae bacterium]|nr:MAG: TetR/AcrR family transcriptional regulator [Hyphomicrobiaceae bacterium]